MAEAMVIFSFPEEEGFQMGVGEISDSKGEHMNWVFRPFDSTSSPKYVQIESVHPWDGSLPELENDISFETGFTAKDEYVQMLQDAIAFASGNSGKVVLSRSKQLKRPVNVAASLKAYKNSYPNALVYFLHSDEFGDWMGATPEILIAVKEDEALTYALAGTKWNDELFGQKEFDEQMIVVKDIMEQLNDYAIEVGDVRESSYGTLRHLRTEIKWEKTSDVVKLAELIHPTAAVNGYPREKATAEIERLERHRRGLYTGYLGLIRDETDAALFVNLRCMQLFRDSALLYAGGGINSQSDPETEWEECERKFTSIENALKFND